MKHINQLYNILYKLLLSARCAWVSRKEVQWLLGVSRNNRYCIYQQYRFLRVQTQSWYIKTKATLVQITQTAAQYFPWPIRRRTPYLSKAITQYLRKAITQYLSKAITQYLSHCLHRGQRLKHVNISKHNLHFKTGILF